jgi:glycosyltransferase involved in cell wall biosynthesis
MHVGLNAQLLSLAENYRGAGISWYIYNLLRQLPRIDPSNRFSVFLNERQYVDERVDLHYTRWPAQQPLARIVWEQLILPAQLRRQKVDLIHAMAFAGPLLFNGPMVVTVYDLSFLRFPRAFRPWNRWYLSQFTRWSAHRARHVIAISESTRQDVINFLGMPSDRVEVVYCGADPLFHSLPPEQIQAFRKQHNLPDKFVLFLGTLEPRKNLDRLLRAYAGWWQMDPDAPYLVIAGAQGWYYDAVLSLVHSLGVAERVIFLGYVPREDLPLLYNSADMFVYPSLFEGFGLPVLEAMACGVPVITSNVSSLPEVAGEAAVLIDPTDTDELRESLLSLWRDSDQRRNLAARGKKQASHFTWERAAEQTVSIYERAMKA